MGAVAIKCARCGKETNSDEKLVACPDCGLAYPHSELVKQTEPVPLFPPLPPETPKTEVKKK